MDSDALIALIGIMPVAVTWLVYDRKLTGAINREIAGLAGGAGEKALLPRGFVSHWTRLAVYWHAAAVSLGLGLLFFTGRLDLPDTGALGVVLLVLVAIPAVAGFSAGAVAQRHMRGPWQAEP